MAEKNADESRFEVLDPEGDVILSIHDSTCDKQVEFLVSSKALSLALPVFLAMFGGNFAEGARLRHENRPCINLVDDNAGTMSPILRIFHHQAVGVEFSVEPETLATLAIHCEKYDCDRALRPWIEHWCTRSCQKLSSLEDFGYVLLAAYLFRSSSLSVIIANVAMQLKPEFIQAWKYREQDVLSRLPDTIICKPIPVFHLVIDARTERTKAAVQGRIIEIREKTRAELGNSEALLREQDASFVMFGGDTVCTQRSRIIPETVKKCFPCRNYELFARHCTVKSRLADFFRIMRRRQLWPTAEPFTTCTLEEILSRFKKSQTDQSHQCAGAEDCPLRVNLSKLYKRVQEVVEEVEVIYWTRAP